MLCTEEGKEKERRGENGMEIRIGMVFLTCCLLVSRDWKSGRGGRDGEKQAKWGGEEASPIVSI